MPNSLSSLLLIPPASHSSDIDDSKAGVMFQWPLLATARKELQISNTVVSLRASSMHASAVAFLLAFVGTRKNHPKKKKKKRKNLGKEYILDEF